MLRCFANALAAFVGCCLWNPEAWASVDISCPCSYELAGDSVTLNVDRITNNRSTTTGTLYLSLWFTIGADPYTTGHLGARVSLASDDHDGTLPPDYYYYDVSLTTDFEPPPQGEYHVHLFVSEYPNLNTTLDLVTFTDTLLAGTHVDFGGTVSYSIDRDSVTLAVDRIENNSDTHTTGTLYLSLWLTTSADPYTAGYLGARASLASVDDNGTLPPGWYYHDVSLTTDFDSPPPGEYYVHIYVSQYPDLSTTLDLVTFTQTQTLPVDDHGDVPQYATVVSAVSSTEGQIETGGDVDVFRIDLARPGTLRVTTQGTTDTYGVLRDRDLQAIRADDDSGEGLNFRIDMHVASGASYVEVQGYDANETGDYTLNVAFDPDPDTRGQDLPIRQLGDFNGDGHDDVLLRHADGRWYYYPMDGRNQILVGRGFANLTRDLHHRVAGIGDFDGDGRDDVLLRHVSGHWYYYPMNGRHYVPGGQGPVALTTDLNYRVAGIGDFNGDDRDDVLLRNRVDGRWYYYPMDGRWPLSGGQGYADLTPRLDYQVAGIGDFDGDGRDDVLLRNDDGTWFYYPMNGSQHVAGSQGGANLTDDLNYALADIGDFDGDGRDDVLLRHTNGHWYYYAMDGARYVVGRQGTANLSRDLGYALAGIGDLNGDGRDDVLLRHDDGSWYYYAMNGRQPLADQEGPADLTVSLAWSMPLPTRDASISGTVRIAQGQILDGDTGDPNDPQVQNDTSSNPQWAPVPVSIAGYLIEALDDWDIYRVSLPASAKTRVSLVIADADDADLDLHLADTDGVILVESLGVENLEVVETTLSGEHLVAVSAFSGASNYSLVVSITEDIDAEANAAATWSRDGEFVPNELIVMPRDDAPDVMVDWSEHEPGLRQAARMASGNVLARMEQPSAPQYPNTLDSPGLRYEDQNVSGRAALLRLRKRLLASEAVAFAQPNYVYWPNTVPDDPYYEYQWHYPKINLPLAWDLTTGDDAVVTAVIDTGVVTDHPDLASRLLRDSDNRIVGYDFISNAAQANDGDGRDPDPFDAGDASYPGDSSSFHGTHVAGTVGATTNNGKGVAGVTWQGKIMPIRVLGIGGGTSADIVEGIRYAAGLDNASGTLPVVAADIMNLSLGLANPNCLPTPTVDAATRDALQAAINADVVVVVAAGNDNCHQPDPMAQVDGVIAVGATDLRDHRAPYSNFGRSIDVVAPGGDTSSDRDGDGNTDGVLSTWGDAAQRHTSRFEQGTSMAAPHVAGVVSLMLAANPDLTPDDINDLLAGTHADPAAGPITWDLGTPGRDDEFGHGLIDAYRAVRVAQAIEGGVGDPSNEPVLNVSPTRLFFGATADTLRVLLSNVGTGLLSIQSIESDVSWLSVFYDEWPKLVMRVDRGDLADGTYVGRVSITSDGGDSTVFVTMQVQANLVDADVGTVYVLMLDPVTYAPSGAWATTDVRGGYAFTVPVVPDGRYVVAAGTDRDGDGFICDAGEACGVWPLLDSPGVVEVEGDETVEFGVSIDLFARVSSQSAESDAIRPEGFRIDRSEQGQGTIPEAVP